MKKKQLRPCYWLVMWSFLVPPTSVFSKRNSRTPQKTSVRWENWTMRRPPILVHGMWVDGEEAIIATGTKDGRLGWGHLQPSDWQSVWGCRADHSYKPIRTSESCCRVRPIFSGQSLLVLTTLTSGLLPSQPKGPLVIRWGVGDTLRWHSHLTFYGG